MKERFYGDFMQVCEHCKYRHSWDCDDGRPYPKGGCDDFELDPGTLTNKQKKAIKRVLRNEEYSENRNFGGWD